MRWKTGPPVPTSILTPTHSAQSGSLSMKSWVKVVRDVVLAHRNDRDRSHDDLLRTKRIV
jgi:hypothetical protein